MSFIQQKSLSDSLTILHLALWISMLLDTVQHINQSTSLLKTFYSVSDASLHKRQIFTISECLLHTNLEQVLQCWVVLLALYFAFFRMVLLRRQPNLSPYRQEGISYVKRCSLSLGTDTQKQLAVSALKKNFHQKPQGVGSIPLRPSRDNQGPVDRITLYCCC